MDIYCNENHDMVRKSVRDFAETVIQPKAQTLDQQEKFSIDITKKMGEIGLMGMVVPEKFGGGGMDYLSYIIAVEELARIDGSHAATIAAHNSLGIGPILNFGRKEKKEEYLPKLCTGKKTLGFWPNRSTGGVRF
jgi:alkylation response protein AidB-like acyl-CoA dehydrogenase